MEEVLAVAKRTSERSMWARRSTCLATSWQSSLKEIDSFANSRTRSASTIGSESCISRGFSSSIIVAGVGVAVAGNIVISYAASKNVRDIFYFFLGERRE